MDKNEMDSILGALERINRSLNERFEKNADLYIAPETVEKLKKLIYVGNYPHIAKYCTVMKKFSAEVLANVLIQNAWLMRSPKFEQLQPVFEECNKNYLQSVMVESVLDNKIEMPPEFRLQLISIFLSNGDSVMCRQMLEQNPQPLFLNHPQLKAICIRQALKNETLIERYKLLNDYFEKNKELLMQEKILNELFPTNEFTETLKQKIFEEQIKPSTSTWHFWINTLVKDGVSFIMEQFKQYCKLNPSRISEAKGLLGKLQTVSNNDFKTFAEKFAQACAYMDGDRKEGLAKSLLSRINAGSAEEKILIAAFNRNGISNVTRNELADINEIIKCFNEYTRQKYEHSRAYFAKSFDTNYYSKCEKMLDKLQEEIPESRFEDFCFFLVKSKFWHLKYLLYAIDYLEDAESNDDLVKKILMHIKDKNILQNYKNDPNIGKIIDFVKSNDFDLFVELNQF